MAKIRYAEISVHNSEEFSMGFCKPKTHYGLPGPGAYVCQRIRWSQLKIHES